MMADAANLCPCDCVKWHAPRPTRFGTIDLGNGETKQLCPTTYTAVTDVLEVYAQHDGKPKRHHLTPYPKKARDMAKQIWTARMIAQARAAAPTPAPTPTQDEGVTA